MRNAVFGVGALVAGLLMANLARGMDTVLIQSTFTTGLDGWTSDVPGNVAWQPKGGKRKGFVKFTDSVQGGTFLFAPAEYFQFFRGLSGKDRIVFYHRVIVETAPTTFEPYMIRLSGPGGAASWTGSPPVGPGGWVKLVVPLKPTLWTISSGTWKELLRNVTSFSILIELAHNTPRGETDIEGIDRVQLIQR